MKTKARDIPYCGVNEERIKKANPVLNEENMGHLLDFITERYLIHVRKDIKGKLAPWTQNPVLNLYKFTNVFREDDRVTRALIELVSHNSELSYEEKVVNTFLFRCWNNPDTFIDFGGPWTASAIYAGLKLKERVRPVYHKLLEAEPERKWWSNAYNQGGTKYAWKFPDGDGFSRARTEALGTQYSDYEADIPLRTFHIGPWLLEKDTFYRLSKAKDQKEAFSIITEIRGFAKFLAYQVFVDLTYIEDFPFSENEFTVAGPGCCRGLDLVFDDYDGMSHEDALFFLRDNINEYFYALEAGDYTGPAWNPEQLFKYRDPGDRCLNVMCLENCFCELSKYIRTVNGTGRPRNKYKATQSRYDVNQMSIFDR